MIGSGHHVLIGPASSAAAASTNDSRSALQHRLDGGLGERNAVRIDVAEREQFRGDLADVGVPMSAVGGIVLQKSKIERRRNSRKS